MKTAGMGDNFYLGGYDVSGDTNSLGRIGGGPAPWDVTAINVSGMERLGLLRDGAIEFVSYFNPAVGQAHPVLSALPTANVIGSYYRGTAIGNPAASTVAKQINYDGNRGQDGSFTFSVQLLPNAFGIEWGDQLTAGKRTDTGATNGTSHDLGTASPGAFGAQFYLHVFSFTGTDATVKIQESSDNAAGDPFADVVGGGFTQITSAPGAQRIATGLINVERYLRVVTVTTGGFSSLIFAVMGIRNATSVVF
jgi:hypothetical protein